MDTPRPTVRVDKWLWHARFFKTRSLAAKLVTGGHLRINAARIAKPSHAVAPDDVLTFPQGRIVRVIRVNKIASRRGPAPEAQALYSDIAPKTDMAPASPKSTAKGRPTKKDRRDMRLSRDQRLE